MSTISLIVLILGSLLLIEGLVVSLFPVWAKKVGRQIVKNAKAVRKAGLLEILLGIILILIGLSL